MSSAEVVRPVGAAATFPPARSFAFYRNATFASLLVGYAGYYLCRQNLSAAMPILETHGFDKSQLGWVVTIGTLSYAFGKVATGSLADSKGGRFAFFVGLAGAVVASFLIGASPVSFLALAALWGLNNFFQSMGWAGIVNVLARWFPKKKYGTAMGLMSISYQAGAAASLAFAAQIIEMGLGWRALFVLPATALLGIGGVIGAFLKGSPADVGHALPRDEEGEPDAVPVEEAETTYFTRFREVVADPKFLVMCGLSFVLTLLRTCFGAWLPTYFKALGAEASAGVFKSMAFPILGCAGTLAAGWFSDRFLQGRRAPVMATFLVASAAALVGLAELEPLCLLLNVGAVNLACVLVGVLGFFLLGSYSLVGGVAALDFGARRTAGTAAGLLDGVGYLGAGLAGVGVAETVRNLGWAGAYGIMAVLALAGVVICGFLWNVKPR